MMLLQALQDSKVTRTVGLSGFHLEKGVKISYSPIELTHYY